MGRSVKNKNFIMSIDLNKQGKLERLTKYYMSFRGDYFVYRKFIKDLEITQDFTLETKTQLAGMIRFCQRQFSDSMIIKLTKLTESTIKLT
jgi:intein-encoded DNA endonuclease-like protein